jgi:hypothetical protein
LGGSEWDAFWHGCKSSPFRLRGLSHLAPFNY